MPGILYGYEYLHSAFRRLFNLGHAWPGDNVHRWHRRVL